MKVLTRKTLRPPSGRASVLLVGTLPQLVPPEQIYFSRNELAPGLGRVHRSFNGDRQVSLQARNWVPPLPLV